MHIQYMPAFSGGHFPFAKMKTIRCKMLRMVFEAIYFSEAVSASMLMTCLPS